MRTIEYKVSYEKMISRLPALFAFLEVDEQGVCEIVKATRGEQGNYGRIVANINLNLPTIEGEERVVFKHTCTDGKIIVISNGEKSYRTLIDAYYAAIKDIKWDRDINGIYTQPFLSFMEKGIGLKYVGLSHEKVGSECGESIMKEYPLAPDYVYLGEAKGLYNKMIRMKKQIIFWENHTKYCKEDKQKYIQLKGEYEAYNGDKFLSTLKGLIREAETVAEEYLRYAQGTNLLLKFNVNLVNSFKDLGIVTPYIQEWVAGKRYYEEDVVYYVDDNGYGMTWVCDFSDKKSSYNIDDLGRKYTEGFYIDEVETIYFDNGSSIDINGEPYVFPNNWKPQTLNWVKRNNRYICKNCGRLYEEEEPSECKCGSKEFKNLSFGNSLNTVQKIEGSCNSHLTAFRRFADYMNRNDEPESPEAYNDWLWYYRKGRVFNREEKYDNMGNLGVMYGNELDKGYASGIEAIEGDDKPTNILFDKDGETVLNLASWGDVITDITANNGEDGIGEISFTYWMGAHLKAKKDDRTINGEKEYVVKTTFTTMVNNYESTFKQGDIITKDEYDRLINEYKKYCEERTWYTKDEDNRYKYFFKDFTIDTESPLGKHCGVKYSEKYIYYIEDIDVEVIKSFNENKRYEKGDIIPYSEYLTLAFDPKDPDKSNRKNCRLLSQTIWSLVDEGKFNDYIEGKFDKDYKPTNLSEENDEAQYYYLLYDKMVFNTSDNIFTYDIKIGNNFNKVPYIKTNFETYTDITHIDVEETPLIRYDYYNGVSFQPSVNEDAYVERGVTQAFEKHIKLGEVKTLEDIETYANGGFFTISKEDIDLG